MKTKNEPVKFTKQKMIEDIGHLRKLTMEKQYLKSSLGRLFPTLYCYKVVDSLIELGFLKFSDKRAKGKYYKWNFDTKIDLKLADALFSSVLKQREFLSKKSSENRLIRVKKLELIDSQQKNNLQVEEPLLDPTKEGSNEEKKLPRLQNFTLAQQLMSPDKLARDLGLVPTEEEIENWKKQIAYWKHETESLRIKLEKKSIELEDLESELDINNAYIVTIKNKHQDELDKIVRNYEKLLSEKTLEPTFVLKDEDKKPFVPVLDEIKKQKIESQKPKYLKLFGYMIYEKN